MLIMPKQQYAILKHCFQLSVSSVDNNYYLNKTAQL